MKENIRSYYTPIILFLASLSFSFGQNSNSKPYKLDKTVSRFHSQDFLQDSSMYWQEKAVLHVANKNVNSDKSIFFKSYILLGVHQNRSSLSTVLNVELLNENGEVLKKQFHRISDGLVAGHMVLPKKIEPGKYYLNAYTRWMQNYGRLFFAREEILVGKPAVEITGKDENNHDVLILPEGGTLLNGYDNRLIIKIPPLQTHNLGQIGRILDDKNNEVAQIDFTSKGIGSIIFKPLNKRQYHLVLGNNQIYPIPTAKNQGYLLHVNNIDVDFAKIQVIASSELLRNSIKLVGTSSQGESYFESRLNFMEGNIKDIKISKNDIPNGTFTLRLIDDAGTELARRPIWVDREQLYIDIKPISSNKGKSIFKVKVTDLNNSPVKTQLALSVTQYSSDSEVATSKATDCSTDLLTFPELTEGYKTNNYRKNRFVKDINMILSESDFIIDSIDRVRPERKIKFPIQKGLELSGYAYDLDNNLLTDTEIQIIAQTEDEVWYKETKTSEDGLLKLEDLEINGTAKVVFRTKGNDTKTRLVKIVPLKEWELEENNQPVFAPKKLDASQKNANAPLKSTNPKPMEPINPGEPIELEEVVVNENRLKPKAKPSVYGIEVPKTRIKYQDYQQPKSIGQMLSEIPGVVVSGVGSLFPRVSITGASAPVLWVLDGFPLSQPDEDPSLGGSNGNSLVDIMNIVNPADIERIELMVGANASIYGSRGAGGVILIYTRSGGESKFVSRREGQMLFQGYEQILEFESYYNALSKREKEKTNLLYWNSNLETDKNGEAIIRFDIPFDNLPIKIEASTITPDGKIGSSSSKF